MSSRAVHEHLIGKRATLALAESCTGGALASRLTAFAGASAYLLGAIVAYSEAWKEQFLKVPGELLRAQGAVSREVAAAMAEGLLLQSGADYAVAVTGIAGPTGGSARAPIGTVFIAVGRKGRIVVEKLQIEGGRSEVIEAAVEAALNMLLTYLRRDHG
jgi:nicotinamide-nucleotide amidase